MRFGVLCVLAGLCLTQSAYAASREEEELQDELVSDEDAQAEEPVKVVKKAKVVAEKKAVKVDAAVKAAKETNDKEDAAPVEKKADKKEDKVTNAEDKKIDPFACPESIAVDEQRVDKKHAPVGFTAYGREATYWLETVGMALGDKKMRDFEPYKSSETSSTWHLTDNGKEHYFLVCGYSHTNVVLKKALDAKFQNCTVTPKENPQNPHGPQVLQLFHCE